MTLFDRVFGGNDYNYERTVAAIDNAIATYGEGAAVSFPDTAYSLPCYYTVTGEKISTLGEMKAAMATIQAKMTQAPRLHNAFESGIGSALCAEFLEALKYLNGATPYAEPELGHLDDAFVRELGVPLVTGDLPGVAVILGGAENPAETVALAKSYQAQGILVAMCGDAVKHCADAGMSTGKNVRVVVICKGPAAAAAEQAGAMLAETLEKDGLLYVFGCGHSHMLAEELFYRAGGLVPVYPIFETAAMLHEGAAKSSQVERMSGYAQHVITRYPIGEGDVLLLSSTSGINPFPMEMAEAAREKGATVIGISSFAYLGNPSRHAEGKHLPDFCDICVDNHVPTGDATVQVCADGTKAGPVSTIASIAIANRRI